MWFKLSGFSQIESWAQQRRPSINVRFNGCIGILSEGTRASNVFELTSTV
jgi:hypothetical protein